MTIKAPASIHKPTKMTHATMCKPSNTNLLVFDMIFKVLNDEAKVTNIYWQTINIYLKMKFIYWYIYYQLLTNSLNFTLSSWLSTQSSMSLATVFTNYFFHAYFSSFQFNWLQHSRKEIKKASSLLRLKAFWMVLNSKVIRQRTKSYTLASLTGYVCLAFHWQM